MGARTMTDDALSQAFERQALTATTFVEIVDTLVGEFDVIDVMTLLTSRVVQLLDVAAAGILLADAEGNLRVIGASDERTNLLELFQIQNDQGPCLDSFRTGSVVSNSRLDLESPWPDFAAASVGSGLPSVLAVPLRLKKLTIGCLNMFGTKPKPLSDSDIALAQALADVATIAIVQDAATRQATIREDELQHALNSRVAIEQAKGMIAATHAVDMNEAFRRLRAFARNNNRGLTAVAHDIVAGVLKAGAFGARRPPPPSSDRQH
jgi:GAF domain-containing protein